MWHAYRRGWATSRKHLPDVDVAAAGGWKSTETFRRVYQQPDAETMLKVVLQAAELREREVKWAVLAHPTRTPGPHVEKWEALEMASLLDEVRYTGRGAGR